MCETGTRYGGIDFPITPTKKYVFYIGIERLCGFGEEYLTYEMHGWYMVIDDDGEWALDDDEEYW